MTELSWEQVRAFRLNRSLDGSGGLVETARRLGGVHAQVMSCAELALAARVDGVRAEDVRAALWERRELVKTWAMRGTLHLLPADDLALWAGALRTRSYLWRRPSWTRYFGISLEELEALVAAIGVSLDGRGLTREELGKAVGKVAGPRAQEEMASGWGSLLKPVAMEGGLVFAPNRGRNVAFVNPHEWIGPFEPLASEEAMSEVVRRWLRVYGPGSQEDLASWWGIAPGRARKPLEALAGELAEVSVEGRRAWALASDLGKLEKARARRPRRACCPASTRTSSAFCPATRWWSRSSRHASRGRPVGSRRSSSWTVARSVCGSTSSARGRWRSPSTRSGSCPPLVGASCPSTLTASRARSARRRPSPSLSTGELVDGVSRAERRCSSWVS